MVAIRAGSRILPLLLVFLLGSTQIAATGICYKSIISFGDSLADTGNLLNLLLPASNRPPHFSLPPYGRTFFHHPTGRFSDGRLVIDFIAESLGLPFVSPYFGREEAVKGESDFGEGVNFAVAGAGVLDDSFLRKRGIRTAYPNISLGNQIHWFKQMFASLCQKSTDCKEFLGSSLILMGEIGGNDYHPLLDGRSIQEVRTFVPLVVQAIASAINELIKLGAKTLLVPGNLPIGCNAAYLTYFQSSDEKDYDAFGCIKWLNKLSKYHNKLLQNELNRLREIHHPYVNIIYGDYYNAATKIYRSPNNYGFKGDLSACCGGGGPYNYNESLVCGDQQCSCCDDPSLYISWDGNHLTEAAYQWIAKELLQGLYAMSTSCTMTLPLTSNIPKLTFLS